MSLKDNKYFSLDRILLVLIVVLGCSSGMVALVSMPNEFNTPPSRLSFPEPLQKIKGYNVPTKQLAVTQEQKQEVEEYTVEEVPVETQSEVIENVPLGSLLPCSCCKKTIRVPRNPYTSHQKAARSLPNSFFIKNESDIRYGLGVEKLVEVKDGRGYRIDRLKHSKAMLLPEVKALLEEMGNDYADALEGTDSEGTVFRVTSLTRTDEQQRKLARRNRNATRGASTHSYGASFDIAFMDRPNEKANCNRPTREIQKLLVRYQKEGRILIIPEGGCMHITLIR
ncbi:MAG: hypothetical protein CMB32_02245 [Euryarchaeota archaeon]|nr:hypothetical protein [Euryarchaeota archaeon]|tara:strand:- start:1554 stop:2399 length:846 start_codon:yes stop_codon:yes gene_type:complete